MSREQVLEAARRAQASGAGRFCMGAAWRSPKDRDIDRVAEMITGVKQLGLETCVTLGMLKPGQPERLKQAGLDYYNHNLDTSESFYGTIISTRTYQDRLDTLQRVRAAGINVCCGGIIGMGESVDDRAALLQTLACMPRHPESVPVNTLVRVAGTPLAQEQESDPIDLVRNRRGCPYPDAARACAPVRRPYRNERFDPGAVFLCGSEFHILRGKTPDHRKPAIFPGSRPVRATGTERQYGYCFRGYAVRTDKLMRRAAPADPFSLTGRLDKIKSAGLFRTRRTVTSAQARRDPCLMADNTTIFPATITSAWPTTPGWWGQSRTPLRPTG